MDYNSIDLKAQDDVKFQNNIDDFFKNFRIATLMHKCGLKKQHGISALSLITIIFTLPFIGKNFFRGIVTNEQLPFGKDAAYELLKRPKSNWRRLLLMLAARLHSFFDCQRHYCSNVAIKKSPS